MAEQYLPLYRKYRPQEFGDLVGQDNLVKAFTNAINTGKIAHAYLFCGPRGTGKTSSARILAKSLNCKDGPTLTPCGKCPSCQDILNGNMIDVIEMDAASNRSVEDAQNIIDKIHYAPVNGKYKIFIIDEVHMISKTAFNALLKTLEEPPENVIFILATTEPQKVLETIISRCQRFDFKRITVDDIVKRLKYISEKENIKINDDALFAIAKNSQGGMRDALALLDQISVLDVENEITSEKVNEMLGKIDTNTLINLAQSIFDNSTDDAIKIINDIYSKGNEPLQVIENSIQYFRNLSVVKTCKDKNYVSALTLLPEDIIALMKSQAESVDISYIAKIIERLTYYYKEIKYTNNRYLWLELCFIDISSGINSDNKIPTQQNIQPTIPVKIKPAEKKELPKTEGNEIIKELETPTEEVAKSNPSIPEQKPVKKEINIPPVQNIQKSQGSTDCWKDLLSNIDSPPSRSFFTTFAKPVELSESKIVITFKDENFAKRATETSKFDALKKAGLKYYNVASIEIEIKTGEVSSTPKIIPSAVKTEKVISNQQNNSTEMKKTVTAPAELSDKNDGNNLPDTAVEDISQNSNTKPTYENNKYTDQVKMVKDLFDAKIFD